MGWSVAKHYLGYNFTAPIAGSVIPQRLQNLCIRDYAQSKGLTVTFTVSEYWDYDAALMLFAQFGHGTQVAGFVFYSVLLLPKDEVRRQRFFRLVADHHLEVHFALEHLSLGPHLSHEEAERVYRIRTDPRLDQTRETLLRMRSA
jgi:sporadic carbohydrate cluster protein (TIGR04323 family)